MHNVNTFFHLIVLFFHLMIFGIVLSIILCYSLYRKEVIKMKRGERVKILRKSLHLTLEKFGDRLGLKNNTISAIETGRNNLTDSLAKLICREYNVNYLWLTEGVGEMINESSDSVIDEVVDIYHLKQNEEKFLKNLLSLSEQERTNFIDILKKLVD